MKLKKLTHQHRKCNKIFMTPTSYRFRTEIKKAKVDEQFGKFVEVIQKLYINIPLLDAIQVPTYAKYLQDILNNKRPLPTTSEEEGSKMSHDWLFDR